MNRERVEKAPILREKQVGTWLMVGILLFTLCLRLTGLDAKSLWQDEIFTAAISSAENSVFQVASIPLYNTALPAPPLHFLITHFFLRVGDNDLLLRFAPLAFGVLGVAITYALGARLFGREEGLAGALLLSVAPFHIRYSQDARFYALLMFLSLCSLYFLWRGIFDRDRKWWIGFTVCSIFNAYNHLFAFLVLLGQTVLVAGVLLAGALLVTRRPTGGKGMGGPERNMVTVDRGAGLAFVASLSVIALAYAPMFPHLLRGLTGAKGLGGPATTGISYISSVLIQVLDTWSVGSGWAILVLLVPFVIGITVSARIRRMHLWLAFCWLVVPFGVLFAFPARHGFRPRYVLFTLPLYLLFAARGLVATSQVANCWLLVGKVPLRRISLAALLLAITLSTVPSVHAYYGEDRANWRAVATLVARGMSPDDVIVSPGPFPQVVLPRYEESLEGAAFMMAGGEVFFAPDREGQGGVWFVGPAREKMREIDDDITEAVSHRFKVVFKVDDESAARGRALKIAPVMYDDLWVLYVREDLVPEEVIQRYRDAMEVVPTSTAFSIHLTLGDLYRAEDEWEQALAHYQQASILDARAPEPHRGLALVYEAQGLREQAEHEWQAYEDLVAQ